MSKGGYHPSSQEAVVSGPATYPKWKQHIQKEWKQELKGFKGLEKRKTAIHKRLGRIEDKIDRIRHKSADISTTLYALNELSFSIEEETEEEKAGREQQYAQLRREIKQDTSRFVENSGNPELKRKYEDLIKQRRKWKKKLHSVTEEEKMKQDYLDERDTTLRYLSWLESPAPRQPMAEKPPYELLHPDVKDWSFPKPEFTYPAWKEAIQEHWNIELSRFDNLTEREKELNDQQRLLAREEYAFCSQIPGMGQKRRNRQALYHRQKEAPEEEYDKIAKDIEAIDNAIKKDILTFVNANPQEDIVYRDIQERKGLLQQEAGAFYEQHHSSLQVRDYIQAEKRTTLGFLTLLESGSPVSYTGYYRTKKGEMTDARKDAPDFSGLHPDIILKERVLDINGVIPEDVRAYCLPGLYAERPEKEQVSALRFGDGANNQAEAPKEGQPPLAYTVYFKQTETPELSDFCQKFHIPQTSYKEGSVADRILYTDPNATKRWTKHIEETSGSKEKAIHEILKRTPSSSHGHSM